MVEDGDVKNEVLVEEVVKFGILCLEVCWLIM